MIVQNSISLSKFQLNKNIIPVGSYLNTGINMFDNYYAQIALFTYPYNSNNSTYLLDSRYRAVTVDFYLFFTGNNTFSSSDSIYI
jgi:hypothetical protein